MKVCFWWGPGSYSLIHDIDALHDPGFIYTAHLEGRKAIQSPQRPKIQTQSMLRRKPPNLPKGGCHPHQPVHGGILANTVLLGSQSFRINFYVPQIISLLCVEPSMTCFHHQSRRQWRRPPAPTISHVVQMQLAPHLFPSYLKAGEILQFSKQT